MCPVRCLLRLLRELLVLLRRVSLIPPRAVRGYAVDGGGGRNRGSGDGLNHRVGAAFTRTSDGEFLPHGHDDDDR